MLLHGIYSLVKASYQPGMFFHLTCCIALHSLFIHPPPSPEHVPHPLTHASQVLLPVLQTLLRDVPLPRIRCPRPLRSAKVVQAAVLCLRCMSHAKVCTLVTPSSVLVPIALSQGSLRSQGPPPHHHRPTDPLLKLQGAWPQVCVSTPPPSPYRHPHSLSPSDRDEFAEVKAVKLLRRGRRLQQVE